MKVFTRNPYVAPPFNSTSIFQHHSNELISHVPHTLTILLLGGRQPMELRFVPHVPRTLVWHNCQFVEDIFESLKIIWELIQIELKKTLD